MTFLGIFELDDVSNSSLESRKKCVGYGNDSRPTLVRDPHAVERALTLPIGQCAVANEGVPHARGVLLRVL